jgi:4-aminobutyrate---pyruvate transaminase
VLRIGGQRYRALKLVWYYHHAIGKPEKRKIISRRMAYHGSTLASISASGKPDMHADFGLPFAGFLHTEYPHYFATAPRANQKNSSRPGWRTRWKS